MSDPKGGVTRSRTGGPKKVLKQMKKVKGKLPFQNTVSPLGKILDQGPLITDSQITMRSF